MQHVVVSKLHTRKQKKMTQSKTHDTHPLHALIHHYTHATHVCQQTTHLETKNNELKAKHTTNCHQIHSRQQKKGRGEEAGLPNCITWLYFSTISTFFNSKKILQLKNLRRKIFENTTSFLALSWLNCSNKSP